jgi:anaerobic magnesium-protoporphyrin IX monomethyl ester cyclase
MHITLIYPPHYFGVPRLPPGQGASQNLALGYLSSYLKKKGHRTTLINAFNLGIETAVPASRGGQKLFRIGLSYEEIARTIPAETGCIGISVPFSNVFPIVRELAAVVRRRFPSGKPPLVFGGIHASAFPDQCFAAGADYVVAGEGESPMCAFADGAPASSIPGLLSRDGGPAGGASAIIEDLDEIPFPDRSAEDLALFTRYPPRGGSPNPTITLLTSRGCPFACNFCSVFPVYGRGWRARSAANVLEEIHHWYGAHGVRHFEFEDDNLTLRPDRAREIFEGMVSRFPGITWAAHNGVRIDTLDDDLLALMKRSGCLQLNLAIESGNDTVLAAMNKKLSLEKVEEVVRGCGRLGIKAAGFLLVGYPGETEESFGETIRYYRHLRRIGLHAAIPLIVNAYPGTPLYDQCKRDGQLTPGAPDHIFVENDGFVSIVTENFDEFKVRAWKKRAERDIDGWARTWKRRIRELLKS